MLPIDGVAPDQVGRGRIAGREAPVEVVCRAMKRSAGLGDMVVVEAGLKPR